MKKPLVKTFVLDTNVFIDDPTCIYNFEQNKLVIPFKVLEELEKHKTAVGALGGNARASIRYLSELSNVGDLYEGVSIGPDDGSIRICPYDSKVISKMESAKLEENPDNIILATTLSIRGAILVSNDLAMRLKASALNIKSESYSTNNVNSINDVYSDILYVDADEGEVNKLYSQGYVDVPDGFNLTENEFVNIRSNINEKHSGIGIIKGDKLVKVENIKQVSGIRPKNIQQVCAMNALIDPLISMVSILGTAGSGKSLISIAAGLEQVLTSRLYNKLIIIKSLQVVGQEMGFLPGAREEKLRPIFSSAFDSLDVIFSGNEGGNENKTNDIVDQLVQEGKLEFESATFLRGRSLPKTFIIVDEAQNFSLSELKTILTRLGMGSKICLTGDISQIDNNKLDTLSNGLSRAAEIFKDQEMVANITLRECLRSPFAALAAELIN